MTIIYIYKKSLSYWLSFWTFPTPSSFFFHNKITKMDDAYLKLVLHTRYIFGSYISPQFQNLSCLPSILLHINAFQILKIWEWISKCKNENMQSFWGFLIFLIFCSQQQTRFFKLLFFLTSRWILRRCLVGFVYTTRNIHKSIQCVVN